MRTKKTVTAAELVAQALKSIEVSQTNVVAIDKATIALTRIERGIENGAPYLKVVFASKPGNSSTYDLSCLLKYPNLMEPLAQGFKMWGTTTAKGTRANCLRSIRSKFLPYLEENQWHHLEVSQIDEAIWGGFIAFLNRQQEDGQPLHPSTRSSYYFRVRGLLEALRSVPAWSRVARRAVECAPLIPWPGTTRLGNPTEPLSDDHMEAILSAAEKDIKALQVRWYEGRTLLKEGHERYGEGRRDFDNDLGLLMAHLDTTYPGAIPQHKALMREINQYTIRRLGGLNRITEYFYPDLRDMVPFIMLLTHVTAYNPDTVLGLNRADIRPHTDLTGRPSIMVEGTKGRANGREQPRLLDGETYEGQFSIAGMLDFLNVLTLRLRPYATKHEDKDRLFFFRSRNGYIGSIKLREANSDSSWKKALSMFIRDHDLPAFAHDQIRTTVLNQGMQRTGDLRAGQQLGLQRNIMTVATHYTSGATKKKFQEQIGEVMLLRDRYLATNGKLDPRLLTHKQDRASATPGFDCLDVFDSPRTGQRQGRMCDAYGECPACPLAAPNPGEVVNVALWLALRQGIYAAQSGVAPETWLAKWVSILENLEGLLCTVSNAVLKKAASIPIQLPSVG